MSIIKIKKEEVYPIILLMMMFFCIVGSSITGASARDTFFLTQFDRSLLPLMFALVAGLMVVVISIYNKITSNLDLVKTIIFSSVFFCITLFIIRFNLNGFVIPLFYAWTDVIISITIFQFWLLASEIFNARQAKRLFSVIGIGGSIAGISAGYIMRPFVLRFGAENLLIPTIIFIALIGIFAAYLNPFRAKKDNSFKKDTENETIAFSSLEKLFAQEYGPRYGDYVAHMDLDSDDDLAMNASGMGDMAFEMVKANDIKVMQKFLAQMPVQFTVDDLRLDDGIQVWHLVQQNKTVH